MMTQDELNIVSFHARLLTVLNANASGLLTDEYAIRRIKDLVHEYLLKGNGVPTTKNPPTEVEG